MVWLFQQHRSPCRLQSSRGLEFFLNHHLYRSHRTGRIVNSEMTRLHFPPGWHYDILRGLDFFRSVNTVRDERLADPIDLLVSRQMPNGRWLLNKPWIGHVHFDLEAAGRASRWNTLRALRVLKWWRGSAPDRALVLRSAARRSLVHRFKGSSQICIRAPRISAVVLYFL